MPNIFSRPKRHSSHDEPWEIEFPPMATESDILYCFRLLLGRRPGKQEWPGHSGRIGEDLAAVVSSYLNSQEFESRHLLDRRPSTVEVIDLEDFSMYVSCDDTYIGKVIAETHCYEPHVSRIFREYVKPGMGVLDVGANIGYFSLLAAFLTGPSGMVYSWEPSPDNTKMLYASQLRSRFSNIKIIQAAATQNTSLLKYFRNSSNGTVAGVKDTRPEDILSGATVMGLRIDDVVPSEARIGFVKIDVEGHEYEAVRGAMQTIRRNRPVVVSEFSPPSLHAASGVSGLDYLDIFAKLDYETLVITEAGPIAGNPEDIMLRFEQSGVDHIDILLKPRVSQAS